MALFPAFLLAALAGGIALAAGALTLGGAVAASFVGGAALAAGWSWAALLLTFFVPSSLLSHGGPPPSEVGKSGARDAIQVCANGGIATLAAVAHLAGLPGPWNVVFAAALATANADTWATEIGRYSSLPPRLITTGRQVATGVSGGVSRRGTFGAAAGAGTIGLAGILLTLLTLQDGLLVAIAGFCGAVADSVLGATLQERRYCDLCHAQTEQELHLRCGSRTRIIGGMRGVNNDVVNFAAGVAGALLALLARAWL